MDLLSQRYANPCFFLDGMIETGRFAEFVDELIDTVNKETEEKTAWEFYLHRVFDQTFEEFRESMKIDKQNQEMSAKTIETTVQGSLDILKNFNPTTNGGEKTWNY